MSVFQHLQERVLLQDVNAVLTESKYGVKSTDAVSAGSSADKKETNETGEPKKCGLLNAREAALISCVAAYMASTKHNKEEEKEEAEKRKGDAAEQEEEGDTEEEEEGDTEVEDGAEHVSKADLCSTVEVALRLHPRSVQVPPDILPRSVIVNVKSNGRTAIRSVIADMDVSLQTLLDRNAAAVTLAAGEQTQKFRPRIRIMGLGPLTHAPSETHLPPVFLDSCTSFPNKLLASAIIF